MTTINENIKFEEQLWSYGRVRVQGLLGNLPPDTAAQSPPVEWAMWSTLTRYAAASGFALGALIGGRTAGLRFTAERSHQKPTSKSGWFLYHRQKNYTIALGGIKKGILFAGKFAGWMGCFYALDIALDIYDGRRVQWWHAPLAGISMGSLFSLVRTFGFCPMMVHDFHLATTKTRSITNCFC